MAKQSSVYRTITCMLILFSPAALATTDAYLTDSSGRVVRNSDGDCWRTSMWTPAKSGECNAGAKAASVSPVVPPATQAAAPSEQVEQVPPPVAEAPIPAPVPPVMEQAEATPVVESINVSSEALFDFDQADIKPGERQKLSDVIGKIKDQQDVEVVITGRADAIGTEAYNQELSKKRAENVKELLLSEGVRSDHMVIQAVGEDQPVASNSTEDGRAQNRRVDISVQTIATNK